jgi:sulfotransferase family protein
VARASAPFFVIGSERSGTTLLMIMLGMHPSLAVPEVSWWYPRFRPYLHTYGDLRRPERFRTLVDEMVWGLKTPFFGLPVNARTITDEVVRAAPAPTFAGVFEAMLRRYADHAGKPRWGEKTPHNVFFVAPILEDFPGARFIHLVRDGRDVAVDQLRSAFGPRNVYAAARLWAKVVLAGNEARAATPRDQWLDVSYEALVRNPAEEMKRVLAFLEEDFDPRVLRPQESDIAQIRARTRDHRALGGAITTEFVGIYRSQLSTHDQGIFVGVAGDALRELGYAVGVEPIDIDEVQAALHLELDERIRAATLDAPEGHIAYESYNDWLVDQREERGRRGLWSGSAELTWEEQLISGQRAPRHWKNYFAVKRRYTTDGVVL